MIMLYYQLNPIKSLAVPYDPCKLGLTYVLGSSRLSICRPDYLHIRTSCPSLPVCCACTFL